MLASSVGEERSTVSPWPMTSAYKKRREEQVRPRETRPLCEVRTVSWRVVQRLCAAWKMIGLRQVNRAVPVVLFMMVFSISDSGGSGQTCADGKPTGERGIAKWPYFLLWVAPLHFHRVYSCLSLVAARLKYRKWDRSEMGRLALYDIFQSTASCSSVETCFPHLRRDHCMPILRTTSALFCFLNWPETEQLKQTFPFNVFGFWHRR